MRFYSNFPLSVHIQKRETVTMLQITTKSSKESGDENWMGKNKGFSLIELIVVVAVILIIIGLTIPKLMRTKMAANEASAAASVRVILSANSTQYSIYNIGYAGSLAQMGPTSAPCPVSTSDCASLIDSLLSGVAPLAALPVKSGYVFIYTAGPAGLAPTMAIPNQSFSVLATPVTPGSSGTSTFCADQSGVIKKNVNGSTVGATDTGCGGFAGLPM